MVAATTVFEDPLGSRSAPQGRRRLLNACPTVLGFRLIKAGIRKGFKLLSNVEFRCGIELLLIQKIHELIDPSLATHPGKGAEQKSQKSGTV